MTIKPLTFSRVLEYMLWVAVATLIYYVTFGPWGS
jgi:hypothetical protein